MGGKNNFFNQMGQKIGVATGLMDDPNARVDRNLAANTQAVQALVGQTAMGQGPSITGMQLQQAMQQLAQQQQQAAASARGVNPALAMRSAAMATENAQSQAAQQAAILAEEERRRAQELLLNQYGQQRGQQISAAQQGQQRLANLVSGAGQAMMKGGAA